MYTRVLTRISTLNSLVILFFNLQKAKADGLIKPNRKDKQQGAILETVLLVAVSFNPDPKPRKQNLVRAKTYYHYAGSNKWS